MVTEEQKDIMVFHTEKEILICPEEMFYNISILSVRYYQSRFNQILITSKGFLQNVLIVNIQNYLSRLPPFHLP